MIRTIYVCETCGRFDVKPLTPNHFRAAIAEGICGSPTEPVEYVRKSLADALERDLDRVHRVVARYGYDDPEPESLVSYHEATGEKVSA
jgi:hypothetical protein